ncbi:MAG TPA: 6-bladed beta-propeller [Noviherbaspirillum sp.]|uniref:6-bladed beta-propeller n=1 Tax=Noviherbaspirillum sp. TaxID=1926288 RepID=UPI002D2BFBCC|nr:6-bladed beta-propeller [Noviherbaspirillum sp.]HYD94705.1 6-bladed beta-propeller [Noviherbaspirillum sp.]
MPALLSWPLLRLLALIPAALLLAGCAASTIRGEMRYDLRPQNQRAAVVLPVPPDKARYRYVGELVGERNFNAAGSTEQTLASAAKWLVGIFENQAPLTLQRPQQGMTDDKGRVYVVDAGRNAILVFDPNPPADGTSDKDGGQLLVWETLGPGLPFGAPAAVVLAWNGDIAVSDVKHGEVFRLNRNGELVARMGAGQLQRPTGLAFDAARGLLYVADTVAHDVKVYDDASRLVNTIGSPGSGAGQLNAPTHLAFANGHLYVTDTFNNRVQMLDPEGAPQKSFGERGLYIGNFARPKGVTVDRHGLVYVVESYFGHLLVFNQNAELLLGINGNGMKGDRFFLPSGAWSDGKDRIYLADMFNGRVVVFQFLGDKGE